jgi:ketosteroid isomerase-like protein
LRTASVSGKALAAIAPADGILGAENVNRLRGILQQLFDCRRLGPELLAEDVEWVNPPDAVEPGRRRGADSFNEAIASVFQAWEDARLDTERVIDNGDDVVVLGQVRGRGLAAGIEVDRPHGQIWTFRDGRVIRMRWFHSHRETLEAAGLPE